MLNFGQKSVAFLLEAALISPTQHILQLRWCNSACCQGEADRESQGFSFWMELTWLGVNGRSSYLVVLSIKIANPGQNKWGNPIALLVWNHGLTSDEQQTSGLASNLIGRSWKWESYWGSRLTLHISLHDWEVTYTQWETQTCSYRYVCVWTLVLSLVVWPYASELNHSVLQFLHL